MGNRLACIFAVPLLIAGSLAAQQTSQGSSTGNGQDSGCSGAYGVNDPNCQQNGQYQGGRYGAYGNGGLNSQMPQGPQDETQYVDSAGQVRQINPNQNYQNYPNQNFPYQNNQYNPLYLGNQNLNNAYQYQQPDPITDFQRLVSLSLGQPIQIFGRQLFRGVPTTFAPLDQTPVTPDYVLGPGDELLIRVWGPVVFNDRLTVDRSGSIYVPKVGSIHVSGIPFSALDKHLRGEIGRVYRNFDLNVNMGQLRSIQVFVMGQARRPGSYTVSSLSSLVNALFASGGPSVQGSMRKIQLKRAGKVVSDFDLYDLLLRGDKSQDPQLLPGDIIYIPPVGPEVAMAGAVRIPAIYELKGETTLEQVIELAGGLSSVASNARVSLERIEEHRFREAMQVTMDAAGKATVIHDGDVLRVFSITPRFEKTVTLRGNLANPGRFAWHEGLRLSDIIPDRESLLTNNYWRNRNKLGIPDRMFFEPLPVTRPMQTSKLDTKTDQVTGQPSVMNNANTSPNTDPNSMDQNIDPLSLDQQQQQQQGMYSGAPAGMYNRRSAGVTAEQEVSGGSLASQQSRIATGSSLASSTERISVQLPAPEIDWSYGVIERLDPATLKTSLLPFRLGALIMDHDASQDLVLQPGDVVTIFSQADIRVPLEDQTKFVKLEGEIASAGTYSVKKGENLRQLIQRAGGFTQNAYLFGSEFNRESTRVLQQQRLDEYVNSLAIDLQREGTGKISSASSAADAAAISGVMEGQKDMISRLRLIRATGRIVIEINPDAKSLDTIPEIALEDGDSFTVPSVPANVNVVGAVYDQNSFLFSPGRRVDDYMKLSGGPKRYADNSHAFVIRADGSVFSKETTNTRFSSKKFQHSELNPGDTIVVPEKLFKPAIMRGFIEWSQVFSQLALGAATIAILAP
jgi:protein involved in polysaccharide export with SLBB domain